ncbi:MAG: hypothetical protein ACI4TT_00690 [Christensenellales bacterium]
MKNIIKFILRMVVTACIVVGVVFLCMHLTNKTSDATLIANTSADYNISQKLDDSHKNFTAIVLQNNQNDFENKASFDVVKAVVVVSDVLEEYYSYYITLTCYENATESNLKNSIVEKIETLNQSIDKSIKFLSQVNSANSSNYTEKNARIVNLFNSLCNQTEILFDTCSLLKQYVGIVNYKQVACTSKTEAVLEMAKDYAKVVFDSEIKGNVYATKSINLIKDATSIGFSKVMQKTLDMGAEDGSLTEIDFVYNYSKINTTYLTQFYSKNYAEKTVFISNLDNFMGTAPEGETEEQLAQRTANAKNQQKYLNSLLYYISTTF